MRNFQLLLVVVVHWYIISILGLYILQTKTSYSLVLMQEKNHHRKDNVIYQG
jgi:hypothetical protein